MGKLDGKAVLVTGASRGIGAEIARLFAAEGGHVVCAARTLREGGLRRSARPADCSLNPRRCGNEGAGSSRR